MNGKFNIGPLSWKALRTLADVLSFGTLTAADGLYHVDERTRRAGSLRILDDALHTGERELFRAIMISDASRVNAILEGIDEALRTGQESGVLDFGLVSLGTRRDYPTHSERGRAAKAKAAEPKCSLTPPWDGEDRVTLRSRVRLSAIIGRTVTLAKWGLDWQGQCPFDGDEAQNFLVSDTRGVFHCFGCGAHGDVIDWWRLAEGLPLLQAIERLKREAGKAKVRPDGTSNG